MTKSVNYFAKYDFVRHVFLTQNSNLSVCFLISIVFESTWIHCVYTLDCLQDSLDNNVHLWSSLRHFCIIVSEKYYFRLIRSRGFVLSGLIAELIFETTQYFCSSKHYCCKMVKMDWEFFYDIRGCLRCCLVRFIFVARKYLRFSIELIWFFPFPLSNLLWL